MEFHNSKGGKNQEIKEIISLFKSENQKESLLQKIKQIQPNNATEMEYFKILNINDFLVLVEKLLADLEEFLKKKPKIQNFFDLVKENEISLTKIYLWNNCNKYRMYFLYESSGLNLEIFLKNGFETHGRVF